MKVGKRYEMDTLELEKPAKDGFFITKCTAVILVLATVALVVTVGLLAGLVRPAAIEVPASPAPEQTTTSTAQTTTSTSATTTSDGATEVWHNAFLPNFTNPIHYDLYLDPHFYHDDHWFFGNISIEINVTSATNVLIVHYKQMNITNTRVTEKVSNKSLDIAREFAYDENEYWVTELKDTIPVGQTVLLHLDFNGDLENGIVGYYKSTYTNSITGEESWLATSKFQPTHSRKAFPNFDEPQYKATFTVTLKHWANFTALSNMLPEMNKTIDADFVETTFQKSVPMSSYLVCFIVCDFKYTEETLNSGKTHRVWAQPDRIEQTRYALEVGTIVQNFLEKEYNITLHTPKLDQIAIPDYPSGATEHWGLITYRVTSLLFDEDEVSTSGRERVASIVAHELVHNYFGNPVTCHWWNDIWLNEGFATWVSSVALEKYDPSWRATEKFVVNTLQSIMRSDAYNTSRPVVVPVETPDQINEAFDGITYSKGASVIRFMENLFGKDNFREGIQYYLKKFEYKTATTDGLWEALQEKIGNQYGVKTIMDTWTRQMGLPVVTITENGTDLKASQSRFLINPEDDPNNPTSPFNYKWHIPLSYNTSSGETGRIWLNTTDQVVFPNPLKAGDQWIKFNTDEYAFARINYDQHLWSNLSTQLGKELNVFSPVDRANLLDDAFNLARARKLSYPTALDMTSYMSSEMDYMPWKAVTNAFYFISDRLYGRPNYYRWQTHVQKIVEPIMKSLGLEDAGGHLDKLLRTEIVNMACFHEYGACLQNASVLFQDWIADEKTNAIKPNLREPIYRYGMQESGSGEDWDAMLDRYKNSTVDQEKLNLLRGLSSTPKVWLLQRYLEYTRDESIIRSQDFFNAISYIGSNKVGNLVAWNWVRSNYESIVDRFGLNNRYLGRMIPDLISDFSTEYQLQEVEAFFTKYPDAGAGARGREQAISSIKTNIKWLDNNEKDITQWLEDKYV